MPMIDSDTERRVRALSQAAYDQTKHISQYSEVMPPPSWYRFRDATPPAMLLALLDTIAELRRERDARHEALCELVACKDLKERAEDLIESFGGTCRTPDESAAYCQPRNEYLRRKHAAWQAARALTKQQDTDPTPTQTGQGG